MVKTSRPAQHNSSNGWEFSGGSKEISYLWYKIALSTALILIGLGIYWMDPAFFPRAFSLSVRGDIQGTVEYLRSFGVKAAWVSLLLLTIINMLGFLPNIFLIVANGFLFGIVPGILISWAGECLGAALGFFAMRHLFQDSARKLLAKSGYAEKVEEFSSRNGVGLILAGRMFPFMPSGVLTAAGALSSVSFCDFFIATCVGKIFSIAVAILAGHDIVTFHENIQRLVGVVAISMLTGWVYLNYVKRCRKCG